MNQGVFKFFGVIFENVRSIAENKYLVASGLMDSQQILQDPEFSGICSMYQFSAVQQTILISEFLSHLASDLDAIWFGETTFTH